MRPTRRDLLRGGLYGGALAFGGPVFFPARPARAAGRPVDPRGTTLEATIVRGSAAGGGYRLLTKGPGEPHLVRDDLSVAPQAGRAARRTAVAVFVHITDSHIADAQSPARVEFLDRYNDAPTTSLPFASAYRPQEMLTAQLADAAIRGAREVQRGPVTGARVQFAVATGDNIDNCQYNELRWFIDLMDGKTVTPDSGDATKWEGVHDQDMLTYDIHYWHPDGTVDSPVAMDDNARRQFGYPTVPGLLDAARRPFQATGIGVPWYTAFGNHDPLMQGNVAPNPVLNQIAVGPLKIVGLPAGLSPGDAQTGLLEQDPAVLTALLAGPARQVTADPNRRTLTRHDIIAEHFVTTTTPVGHGFTQANLDQNVAYYAFDHGAQVRCVVLDTVNPGGYADGSIDADQLEWLAAELAAASKAAGGRDKLVVLFSHHTIGTMNNPVVGPEDTGLRIMGAEVRDLVLGFPNVVLWVNGHTHANAIQAYRRAGGGGFFEVNTAAHIDFPHQSRIIELVDNRDGTISIFTTVVDADAPLSYGGKTDTPAALAALGRELGGNDWHARGDGALGPVEAHNTELVLAAPFRLSPAAVPSVPQPAPSGVPLPATGLGMTAPAAAVALTAAALAVRQRAQR